VEESFRKDLTHLTWAEVYARQEKRAHLLDAWMDALQLRPGDHVLEVGAGPGFVSMALARRVGPGGLVYAVDKSADALAHLERLQRESAVPQIQRIVADAATFQPSGLSVHSALITMVLHHAVDPVGILRSVFRLLPPGGLAVVAEFHPMGSCEHGPPREHRIDPRQIHAWCDGVGLSVLDYRRQSPEYYMVLVQRASKPRHSSRLRVRRS
jgi:ubiquinone/menaquinone biosynthesis C-methylase UbiE